jgi:hypothetical protein
MPNAQEIYKKYTNGEHLTDDELVYGIDFFSYLATQCSKVGEIYQLVTADATRVANSLISFQASRVFYTSSGLKG